MDIAIAAAESAREVGTRVALCTVVVLRVDLTLGWLLLGLVVASWDVCYGQAAEARSIEVAQQSHAAGVENRDALRAAEESSRTALAKGAAAELRARQQLDQAERQLREAVGKELAVEARLRGLGELEAEAAKSAENAHQLELGLDEQVKTLEKATAKAEAAVESASRAEVAAVAQANGAVATAAAAKQSAQEKEHECEIIKGGEGAFAMIYTHSSL